MVARARFTLGDFFARFGLALLMTGATYNPTRYSAISWLGLFRVAGILAIGMSWSHWRRGRALPPG